MEAAGSMLATVRGGPSMTTISTADLTSELLDLSAVPFRELRDRTTPELAHAVHRAVAFSTANKNEIQVQDEK
ncbi:hypothetical protein AOZ06_43065 [Kibdelosporangium phytohabitans]|uniref:Uncharacterized protein n=2 Tax=Kibdelosporangium phytohabitans TaxID=860235 RepID=A0A0N9I4B2_9PSEU|nr:hypothetical protein AOZ06_43065 [Kibdelosporangium phytohabitans]